MSDNTRLNAGAGGDLIATDECTVGAETVNVPRGKIGWGPDGTYNEADTASGKPLPVQLRSATGTELATAAAPVRTDPTGTTAQPVTDNGGSLTVDGSVSVSGAVDTELTTADLDTGAGTDTRAVVGLVLAAGGGGLLVGSANPMPVSDNGGSLTVDGTVTANIGTAGGLATESTLSGRLAETTFTGRLGEVQANPTANTVLARLKDLLTQMVLAAGDNNIGNVDLASAIPAGTNLIGRISGSAETSTLYDGTTALVPKFASIDASASGDNTVVAAVASKKIRVLDYVMISAGTVTARWKSGASTNKSGPMPLVANSGAAPPWCPVGKLETASGEALVLNLSGAVAVGGHLVFIEV